MRIFKHFENLLDYVGLQNHDCHPELPRDKEFQGLGLKGGAINLSEAVYIQGLVHVVKPDILIELGTANGGSTIMLGAVLKDIGKGTLYSIDTNTTPPGQADKLVKHFDLPVNFITGMNSMDYLETYKVKPELTYLIFSDTHIPVRPLEVHAIIEKFPKGTIVVVHDTNDKHPFGPMNLKEKIDDRPVIQFPTPRGISVLEV